jgi:hypothetical protein
MGDMRDKISDILWDEVYVSRGDVCGIEDAADSIIAALPDMVKPLEWEGEDDGLCTASTVYGLKYSITDTWTGKYQVYLYMDEEEIERIEGPAEDLETAKSAANSHHVAQIMAALGVKQ